MAKDVTPPIDTKPTLGLCVITKSYTPELAFQLEKMIGFVDQIYVQVNGLGEFDKLLKKAVVVDPNVAHFFSFKWNDNFADARNALQAEVKTDYWTWMDTDDELRNPELLPYLATKMAQSGTDIVFAPYEYNTTAGVVSELQFRERLIRTKCVGSWHGAVHETWIPEVDAVRETAHSVVWVHQTGGDHFRESLVRNRRILEAEYSQEPRDPRTAYYLGLNYGMDGHYKEAIQCFMELINTSGWDEEVYRSWLQVFSCAFELKDYEQAELAAFRAMAVLPEWPDAYFMLQQLYYQVDDHQKALEWYRVGTTKPSPTSDSAFNPIVRLYQPHELAAYSYLAVGEAEKAFNVLQALGQISPKYQVKRELKLQVIKGVNDSKAVASVKFLTNYMGSQGNSQAVLEALPPELKADIRLTDERRRFIPGKKWPKGSVVFYCGPSFEEWGPDTLDKGMGGSEEAIVYLSRELGKTRDVAVFNELAPNEHGFYSEPIPAGQETGVMYYPWTEVNPNDEFDTFVAWRSPAGIENIKARRKLVDLHDIIDPQTVYTAIPHVDKFLFKSQFHRSLYPEVPEQKVAIIGNGIPKEHFI